MASCSACNEPLVFPNEDGVDVPDDLQLACGCHFHWECLFENAAAVASSLSCPSCGRPVASSPAGAAASSSSSSAAAAPATRQILTRYTNESGLQDGYDIAADLAEEAYYAACPQLLRARPFLAMCSEGHVEGVIELCREADGDDGIDDEMDDDDDDEAPPVRPVRSAALLRHQDPLNHMATGLHVAIASDQVRMAYLLLYLASRLPLDQFPPELRPLAAQVERPERDIADNADIRSLQTADGETAEALALRRGGVWAEMAQRGILSP